MIYEIINIDEVPDDLPPGKYDTKVISFDYNSEKNDFVLKVEWMNKEYSNFSCLCPMIKHY